MFSRVECRISLTGALDVLSILNGADRRKSHADDGEQDAAGVSSHGTSSRSISMVCARVYDRGARRATTCTRSHGPVAVTALLPPQQRVAHHPDRMDHPAARPLLDLDLAGPAAGRPDPDPGFLDAVEQRAAHPHRQIEVLLLHAEGPGDAAAVILADRDHFDLRNEPKQPDHRLPHPPRLEMTWVVVGEAHGYRTQAGARRRVGVENLQDIVADVARVARHDVRLRRAEEARVVL